LKTILPLLALLALSPIGYSAPAPKPNIIFILADDLGTGDVSCYGADNRKTPQIDQLAARGLRFTHAYTAPLCGPSRACIMTGRYAFRTGGTNQDRIVDWKSSNEKFTPAFLKPAGYATSIIGKWSQFSFDPAEAGFDDSLRFFASGRYWADSAGEDDQKARKGIYVVNGTTVKQGKKEYLPDTMEQHLFAFIDQHREQPFYIYYSMSHVHGEIVRTPDSAPDSKDLYVDNCAYMDKLVGNLVRELERQKLSDNTILVFCGDNGTAKSPAENSTIGGRRLVGQKGTMQEGGALVPLIVYWPGVTPKGKVCEDLVDSTDYLPTFAEIAGVSLPKDIRFDGRSLVAQWRGERGHPRDWIFIELARNWYVREAAWKLNQSGELFDMSGAPFTEPLVPVEQQSTEAAAARARLQTVLTDLDPAGGILDDGDGTGRHANKATKPAKKTKAK
jgi:arylsulfatase A